MIVEGTHRIVIIGGVLFQLEDFLPVLKLYDLLYPEVDSIPVPDISKPSCTLKMAVTCIWIHLTKKAISEKVPLQRPVPRALAGHIE